LADQLDDDDGEDRGCAVCGQTEAGYRAVEINDRLARLICEECEAVNAELCCENAYAEMLAMCGVSDA
jgi:hypothetical protein